MSGLRVTLAFAGAFIAVQAHAKVIYEDEKVICHDNGRCLRKSSREELEMMRQFLKPEEQRGLDVFLNGTKDQESLMNMFKDAMGGPAQNSVPVGNNVILRTVEGAWAETPEECQDEEGPNSRTIINLNYPKLGPVLQQYENICRIERANPSGGLSVRLSMSCFEAMENLERNIEGERREMNIEQMGAGNSAINAIGLDGRRFVRCQK